MFALSCRQLSTGGTQFWQNLATSFATMTVNFNDRTSQPKWGHKRDHLWLCHTIVKRWYLVKRRAGMISRQPPICWAILDNSFKRTDVSKKSPCNWPRHDFTYCRAIALGVDCPYQFNWGTNSSGSKIRRMKEARNGRPRWAVFSKAFQRKTFGYINGPAWTHIRLQPKNATICISSEDCARHGDMVPLFLNSQKLLQSTWIKRWSSRNYPA